MVDQKTEARIHRVALAMFGLHVALLGLDLAAHRTAASLREYARTWAAMEERLRE